MVFIEERQFVFGRDFHLQEQVAGVLVFPVSMLVFDLVVDVNVEIHPFLRIRSRLSRLGFFGTFEAPSFPDLNSEGCHRFILSKLTIETKYTLQTPSPWKLSLRGGQEGL